MLPLAAWVLSTPCEPRHVGCMDVWLPRELVGGRPTSITSRQEGPDVQPDRNTHQAQACISGALAFATALRARRRCDVHVVRTNRRVGRRKQLERVERVENREH